LEFDDEPGVTSVQAAGVAGTGLSGLTGQADAPAGSEEMPEAVSAGFAAFAHAAAGPELPHCVAPFGRLSATPVFESRASAGVAHAAPIAQPGRIE
jgi:hypothetical protein